MSMPEEIQTMSPMRGMDFARDTVMNSKAGYSNSPITTDRGVTCRDRFDCQRCDLVLVNYLGATKPSLGTAIELGWADAARIPIVMVIEDEGNPNDHNMIRELVGFRVNDLDTAIELVEQILIPSGRGTARLI
jgi:nucleoside 2-deoxyribosyltransferase